MITYYFKIAWRNILKNKAFSIINIIGLSIGFSASFVIGIMAYYDLTFDKFHQDNEQIYRITSKFTSPEGNFYNSGFPLPLDDALKENLNIELVSPFFDFEPDKIKNPITKKEYKNPEKIIFTDANYFKLLHYNWLAGSLENTLSNPNEIILTKTRATKYFPNSTPSEIIGKTLIYNNDIPLKIVGVVNNFEKRSDFISEEFISIKSAASFNMKNQVSGDEWNNTSSSSQLFVKLVNKNKKEIFQNQLNKLAKEHEDKVSLSYGLERQFYLQPLNDLHFNSNYGIFDNSTNQSSKTTLISLALVALFLLLLGCINFINLNTANAIKRAKEIGVRKTLGSSKKQLVFQFLGETFLLTLISAVVSLFFSVWLFQIFSDYVPKNLNLELFTNPTVIILAIILLLAVTLLSGFYPALILSQFKPISVLKGQFLPGNNKSSLRKYLTVFQFVIAQVFIIATILVGNQISFLVNKDMGFKTEAIASVRTPWNDKSMDKRTRFIQEIKKLPQIGNISLGGNPPASFNTHATGTTYFENEKEIHTSLQLLYGDQNYLDLYNLKLLAGRKRLNDTIREYVINEAYMRFLGFKNPQDAIGEILVSDENRNPIVGVMEDFNQRSLKTIIEPMALIGDWNREYSQFSTIHFSLQTQDTENWSATVSQVENIWKNIYPDADLRLNFMDETIEKFYRQERKTSLLLNWATGLAILISCLGLLGLVIHTTERRTKEIGIRKVLGASLAQLNLLLCKEFLILVGIAFVIAAPIAWYFMNDWLQTYSYHTELSWLVFVMAGLGTIGITLLTVSYQSLKTAMVNPVKSLKTE